MADSSVGRRRFLELCGVSTLAALAGCSSSAPQDGATTTTDAPQPTVEQTEAD
ncbi:hypothetical protein [Halobacterium noricense]|uniref:hypothetical protein n=1 Tax=Halobacterium noricense TaxID=223182 RepID=UPI001E5D3164|nr:hypothetical protein [Halobacterium noricense]UHH24791.1 hypothetical protein LT974_12480 [Halobacterium noricense]